MAARPTAAAPAARGPSAAEVMALYRDVPFEEVPLDGMRKTIATRLVQAKQTIPHFYLTADVAIGRLLSLREEANAAAPKGKDGDTRLPAVGQRSRHQAVGDGAAARAGGERGLGRGPHPAVQAFRHRRRGCDRRRTDRAGDPAGGDEIAHGDLKPRCGNWRRGRAKKSSSPANTRAASSAISNLGMYGVREFSAIINPPHATILAVGAARRQAVEKPDGWRRLRERDDGNAVLRSSRGRWRAWRRTAGGVPRFCRAAGHGAGVNSIRHPEAPAEGGPRRMSGPAAATGLLQHPGHRPSRLACARTSG